MIDQGLSTEARAYFQNEPSLSIDKIKEHVKILSLLLSSLPSS